MKNIKYIFIILSILSLGAIAYCYFEAGTFLFGIQIIGLPEMFISACVWAISSMGLMTEIYLESDKIKKKANDAIAGWHKENKELREHCSIINKAHDAVLFDNNKYRGEIIVLKNDINNIIKRLPQSNRVIELYRQTGNIIESIEVIETDLINELKLELKRLGDVNISCNLENNQLREENSKIKLAYTKASALYDSIQAKYEQLLQKPNGKTKHPQNKKNLNRRKSNIGQK